MSSKDKERAARAHKRQVSLLSLSANLCVSYGDRIAALRQLGPKYFIKAIDETLEIKLLPEISRKILLEARERICLKQSSVREIMNELETSRTDPTSW